MPRERSWRFGRLLNFYVKFCQYFFMLNQETKSAEPRDTAEILIIKFKFLKTETAYQSQNGISRRFSAFFRMPR